MGYGIGARHRLDNEGHRDVADERQHSDEHQTDQPAGLGER